MNVTVSSKVSLRLRASSSTKIYLLDHHQLTAAVAGGVADQIKSAPAPQAAIPMPTYQAVHPPPVPVGHTVGLKELQQRVEGTLHTLDHQRHAPRQPPPQQHGYRGDDCLTTQLDSLMDVRRSRFGSTSTMGT